MMTDLEMTKLCAQAMRLDPQPYLNLDGDSYGWHSGASAGMDIFYSPLYNDEQAMALVKKFQMVIERDPRRSDYFGVTIFPEKGRTVQTVRHLPDLNRAIVECVARMQANFQEQE